MGRADRRSRTAGGRSLGSAKDLTSPGQVQGHGQAPRSPVRGMDRAAVGSREGHFGFRLDSGRGRGAALTGSFDLERTKPRRLIARKGFNASDTGYVALIECLDKPFEKLARVTVS